MSQSVSQPSSSSPKAWTRSGTGDVRDERRFGRREGIACARREERDAWSVAHVPTEPACVASIIVV